MPEALPSFKKDLYEGKTAFAINSSIFDWKISTMVDFLDFYSRCKLYECLLTCKCKFISLCYNQQQHLILVINVIEDQKFVFLIDL